jgi:hypothetical protein
MAESPIKTKIFYVAVLVFAFLRCFYIHEIQTQRHLPVEVDDAFSYLIRSVIVDKDPAQQSNLLKSFASLKNQIPSKTKAEFSGNRIYHRMKEYYHPGYTLALLALHKIAGFDYVDLWWALLYLLNVYLIVFSALLIRKIASVDAAMLCLGIYGFSFLIVPHQFTAAPREWANAGFIGSLFAYLCYRNREFKGLKNFLPPFFALFPHVYLCLTSHGIGKLLFLQLLSIEFFALLWERKLGFVKSNALLLASTALFAWALVDASFYALGVQTYPKTPLLYDLQRPIEETRDFFVKDTLEYLTKMSFLDPAEDWTETFLKTMIWLGAFLIVFKYQRKNKEPLIYAGGFLVSSVALQFALYFLGMDYQPIQPIFYFDDYYNTVYLLAIAGAFSIGATYLITLTFPDKLGQIIATLTAVVLIIVNINSQLQPSEQTVKLLIERDNFESPKPIVEALNREVGSSGACIITREEVPLFSLALYGNYNSPVAYNQFCIRTRLYANDVSPLNCRYVFLPTWKPCRSNIRYLVIAINRSFILGKIIETR